MNGVFALIWIASEFGINIVSWSNLMKHLEIVSELHVFSNWNCTHDPFVLAKFSDLTKILKKYIDILNQLLTMVYHYGWLTTVLQSNLLLCFGAMVYYFCWSPLFLSQFLMTIFLYLIVNRRAAVTSNWQILFFCTFHFFWELIHFF
jgi:hypothetical protein